MEGWASCDATTPTIDADGLTLIEEFDTDRSSCSIREMRCTFRLDMPIGELR